MVSLVSIDHERSFRIQRKMMLVQLLLAIGALVSAIVQAPMMTWICLFPVTIMNLGGFMAVHESIKQIEDGRKPPT